MSFFRRRANRICVRFAGYGYIPVAERGDDIPEFLTKPPQRIGDDALIRAEGKVRRVRLLSSFGMCRDATYIVDMGRA